MRALCSCDTELFTQKICLLIYMEYPIETTWSYDGSSEEVRLNGCLFRKIDDVKY